MSDVEAVSAIVYAVTDRRCPNHPAMVDGKPYGGCVDCSPLAEEIIDAIAPLLAVTP